VGAAVLRLSRWTTDGLPCIRSAAATAIHPPCVRWLPGIPPGMTRCSFTAPLPATTTSSACLLLHCLHYCYFGLCTVLVLFLPVISSSATLFPHCCDFFISHLCPPSVLPFSCYVYTCHVLLAVSRLLTWLSYDFCCASLPSGEGSWASVLPLGLKDLFDRRRRAWTLYLLGLGTWEDGGGRFRAPCRKAAASTRLIHALNSCRNSPACHTTLPCRCTTPHALFAVLFYTTVGISLPQFYLRERLIFTVSTRLPCNYGQARRGAMEGYCITHAFILRAGRRRRAAIALNYIPSTATGVLHWTGFLARSAASAMRSSGTSVLPPHACCLRTTLWVSGRTLVDGGTAPLLRRLLRLCGWNMAPSRGAACQDDCCWQACFLHASTYAARVRSHRR